MIYHKTEYRERRNHFAFFACSEPLAGFDTQREDFLGPTAAGMRPLAVESGQPDEFFCPRLAAGRLTPCENHCCKPGETRKVIFLLGYQENPAGEKFDPPGSR